MSWPTIDEQPAEDTPQPRDPLREILLTQHPDVVTSPSVYESGPRATLLGCVAPHRYQNACVFVVRVMHRDAVTRMRRQAQTMNAQGSNTYEGAVYPRTEYVTRRTEWRVLAWWRRTGELWTLDTCGSRRAASKSQRRWLREELPPPPPDAVPPVEWGERY